MNSKTTDYLIFGGVALVLIYVIYEQTNKITNAVTSVTQPVSSLLNTGSTAATNALSNLL
jgi:hypothetical protein